LDTTTVADPVHDREDGDRGQEFDHGQSTHRDLASSITRPEECSRGHGRNRHDMRDIIRDRVAHVRIKNSVVNGSAQSKNNTMRLTMIIMALTMTNLTDSAPLKEGKTREVSKVAPVT
jgi:hypothetical protein